MKNEKIEKLVSYFAKHYVNRYWVLLIDTLTSVVSTVLVLGVFDYFSSKDISLGYYLSVAVVSAFISLISFMVTKSYAGVVRHTTMREMWRISFASIIKGVLDVAALFIFMAYSEAPAFSGNWVLLFAVLDMILTLFLLIMVRILLTNIIMSRTPSSTELTTTRSTPSIFSRRPCTRPTAAPDSSPTTPMTRASCCAAIRYTTSTTSGTSPVWSPPA